jgi:hypothetical protein
VYGVYPYALNMVGSASARMSKRQGYPGLFKEKDSEQFWPKKGENI